MATSTFSNLSILVSTVALCFQIHRTKSVDTSHSVRAQICMFLARGTGALNTPARAVALFARFCKEMKITRRNANEFSRNNHDFFLIATFSLKFLFSLHRRGIGYNLHLCWKDTGVFRPSETYYLSVFILREEICGMTLGVSIHLSEKNNSL